MSDRLEQANTILTQTYAIDSTKLAIKTRKEMIADRVQERQAWLDLESAKGEAARLKTILDQQLANDGAYNNDLEELGQLKDKLKSLNETLSDLIVGYRIETGEHQLETSPVGDAVELVLKGKLGKKGKYQTNMFAEA